MVSSGIFIETQTGLVPATPVDLDLEDDLQAAVARYPELLSGDDDAARDRRWLLIGREHGIASAPTEGARFAVDHLFVDETGTPTLVEVKRASDTRTRREVVAQMLDYAANAVAHMDPAVLRASFEAMHDDPDAVIAAQLGDVGADDLWSMTARNLSAGNLRLIFVADRIPRELRTLVEFLNEQMRSMEVLAVEVNTFEADGAKILRARTIGQTQAAQNAKRATARRSWTRETWLAAYRNERGDEEAEVVERLVDWASARDPRVSISFSKSAANPGAHIGIAGLAPRLSIYRYYRAGSITVPFRELARLESFGAVERRKELQARLNAIQQDSIPDDRLDKHPSFPVAALVDPNAFDQFIETLDWVCSQLRSGGDLPAGPRDR